MNQKYRIALLHYWLIRMRGGERVLERLCGMFPEADLFTHAWNREKTSSAFRSHRVTESFIGKLPRARENCQIYLPLMPSALRHFDLSGYDLIISSESGPAKGIRKPAGAFHLCYCHTPMRYLWDLYDDYFRQASLPGKLAMGIFGKHLRKFDLKSAECVDRFAANSVFVAKRIKRIYGRNSVVVHPPVDTDFFSDCVRKPGGYYLFAGALVSYKLPFLALQACMKMNRRIVFAGNGPLLPALKRMAGGRAEFRTGLSDEALREIYAGADALLFPGLEDFGMIPVEAQSAGTPVIAYGAGGALETVSGGETGIFFAEQTPDSLCEAIEEFESRKWEPDKIRRHARHFHPSCFERGIRDLLPEKFR